MTRRENGFGHLGLLFGFILVAGLVFFAYTRINKSEVVLDTSEQSAPAKTPFSFTAAGDLNSTAGADLVLTGIGQEKSDFTLALGDLGYGGNGKETTWCDFVKARVGSEHPFELIAGNHDDGSVDGNITEYAKCLPDRIGNITGNYGTEYYFDFGNMARFIMISPDINTYGFDYSEGDSGGTHLQWVIDAVKDARSKNIDWIVVGMHKNCITVGEKTCEIGADLLNNLVDLKVDLVLQGHEHAYFRSKQLALNPDTCPAMVVNEFNQSCIAKDGDKLQKGAGTIIVISGAGGAELRDVNLQDPEIGYFSSLNGKNVGNSHGYSLFDVREKTIKASFVPVDGSFTDSFSITAN